MSKPRRAPFSVLTVDSKLVLAATCDDNRKNHRTNELVNPAHAVLERIAARKGYAGWDPPHTVSDRTPARRRMTSKELRDNEELPTPRFYPAAFSVGLLNDADGTWRVTAWGADDTGFERAGLPETTARRVYAEIRDYTTINTLMGRHGFRCC